MVNETYGEGDAKIVGEGSRKVCPEGGRHENEEYQHHENCCKRLHLRTTRRDTAVSTIASKNYNN